MRMYLIDWHGSSCRLEVGNILGFSPEHGLWVLESSRGRGVGIWEKKCSDTPTAARRSFAFCAG